MKCRYRIADGSYKEVESAWNHDYGSEAFCRGTVAARSRFWSEKAKAVPRFTAEEKKKYAIAQAIQRRIENAKAKRLLGGHVDKPKRRFGDARHH